MHTELRFVLGPDSVLPKRAHATDSGLDLFSAVDLDVQPGQTVVIPTDLSLRIVIVNSEGNELVGEDLPTGYNVTWTYDARVLDKSGLASKGLTTLAGVIDNGYTGKLGVVVSYLPIYGVFVNMLAGLACVNNFKGLLSYLQLTPFKIMKGDKIAQLVVERVELPVISIVSKTLVTDRGDGGFGSTGK